MLLHFDAVYRIERTHWDFRFLGKNLKENAVASVDIVFGAYIMSNIQGDSKIFVDIE